MRPILIACVSMLVAACGGTDPLKCAGSSCACPAEASCDLSDSGCEGESCSVDCTEADECVGSCGASCSIDCGGGATCDVTVGPSGSVTCTEGATCQVACTGSCSVSCSADSTCELQCAGDAAPRPIAEGGGCE